MPKLSEYVPYLIFRSLIFPFQIGSLAAARRMGIGMSMFFYYVIPMRKQVVARNLRAYFPEWDDAQLKRGMRAAYKGMGRAIGEFAWGAKLTPGNIESYGVVEFEGLEHHQAAHAKGKAVCLVGGHFAMWEWGVCFPHWLKRPFHVVMKRIHNDYIDAYLRRKRTAFGVSAVSQRGAIDELTKHVDSEADYATFSDQRAAKGKGVWVSINGKPVSAMVGSALLSLRFGITLLPLRQIRTATGIKFRFYPAIEYTPTGNMESDLQALTQIITDHVTAWVRERPDEYFLLHDRFKIHPSEREAAEAFRTSHQESI